MSIALPLSSSSVTLIVPTVSHRALLFSQVLRYFSAFQFRGLVIVSDHSQHADRLVIAEIVRQHSDLNICLLRHDPEEHFLTRLVLCARAAQTRYVHLHADDDFILLPTLEKLTQLLDAAPQCAAAMGINIHFDFDKGNYTVQRKGSVSQSLPFERLIAQLESYSSVLYALRRRDEFIETMSQARDRCPDVQFWQYLESCLAVLKGVVTVVPELHYVRRVHGKKWSSQLVASRSPDHFPFLILSPEFQPRVDAFRTALIEACRACGASTIHNLLDNALIHLLYRGFGAMGLPPRRTQDPEYPSEAALHKMLQDSSNPVGRDLQSIFNLVKGQ
jgi:glycosyltransferase domain-containing protein